MPDSTEHLILLTVLTAVLLSIPLMVLMRRSSGRIPPPLPEADDLFPLHQWWRRPDALFAIGLMLAIAAVMGPAAASPANGGQLKLDTSLLASQIIFQLGLVSLVITFLHRIRHYPVWQLFGWFRQGIVQTLASAVLWIVPATIAVGMLNVALVLILRIAGWELPQQPIVDSIRRSDDPAILVLSGITLAIGAPLMEEIIFRGVIYSTGRRWFPRSYALIASSLFFAVVHANLLSLIPLTILGALFALAYDRTRNLAVPVVMHSLFNLSQFLILLHAPKALP
jgi:membrane protease YdiL (CAAX protease family)